MGKTMAELGRVLAYIKGHHLQDGNAEAALHAQQIELRLLLAHDALKEVFAGLEAHGVPPLPYMDGVDRYLPLKTPKTLEN